LRDDYDDYCGTIVREVARRLLSEGKSPHIKEVEHENELIPLLYKDKWKIGWKRHMVCCVGKFAYDPLIGKPVPVEEYCSLIFGKKIKLQTIVSPNETKRYSLQK
jgi:hypothetical protein